MKRTSTKPTKNERRLLKAARLVREILIDLEPINDVAVSRAEGLLIAAEHAMTEAKGYNLP